MPSSEFYFIMATSLPGRPRLPPPDSVGAEFPVDFNEEHIRIIQSVQGYTMTTPERLFALIEAVNYVVKKQIPGDIVECGVWKGGSLMAVARALVALQETERGLYLFDTYEGMPPPTEQDIDFGGVSAAERWNEVHCNRFNRWARAGLAEVRMAMYTTGYDRAHIHFVKGRVEKTVPSQAPDSIAILRLDTDWYESTRHELQHLFPRLVQGGVLIIDDYGHFLGARKAVDEYIEEAGCRVFLNRIDYSGRLALKY